MMHGPTHIKVNKRHAIRTKVANDHTNGELPTNVEYLVPPTYVVIITHRAQKKQQIVRRYLHTKHRSSRYIVR